MAMARLRVTTSRPAASAAARWRRLAAPLLLLLALAARPGLATAQELEPVVGADGEIHLMSARPAHVHRGFTIGLELGLGDATAFGAGQAYSLSNLAAGTGGANVSVLFHLGHTAGEAFRVGLAMGFTTASGNGSGMGTSSATISQIDAELAWAPRGDGPFLRGAAGLAVLDVSSDVSTVAGRNDGATGFDLSVGGGWMAAPWREAYPGSTSHLMAGIDLGWQRYGGNGLFAGQVRSALHWSLRVGFYTW